MRAYVAVFMLGGALLFTGCARDSYVMPEPSANQNQELKVFTAQEVATHNSVESCYTIVEGVVYDLTNWIAQHPGGQEAIKGMCGVDGTAAFRGQHGTNPQQENVLAGYKIGIVQ